MKRFLLVGAGVTIVIMTIVAARASSTTATMVSGFLYNASYCVDVKGAVKYAVTVANWSTGDGVGACPDEGVLTTLSIDTSGDITATGVDNYTDSETKIDSHGESGPDEDDCDNWDGGAFVGAVGKPMLLQWAVDADAAQIDLSIASGDAAVSRRVRTNMREVGGDPLAFPPTIRSRADWDVDGNADEWFTIVFPFAVQGIVVSSDTELTIWIATNEFERNAVSFAGLLGDIEWKLYNDEDDDGVIDPEDDVVLSDSISAVLNDTVQGSVSGLKTIKVDNTKLILEVKYKTDNLSGANVACDTTLNHGGVLFEEFRLTILDEEP